MLYHTSSRGAKPAAENGGLEESYYCRHMHGHHTRARAARFAAAVTAWNIQLPPRMTFVRSLKLPCAGCRTHHNCTLTRAAAIPSAGHLSSCARGRCAKKQYNKKRHENRHKSHDRRVPCGSISQFELLNGGMPSREYCPARRYDSVRLGSIAKFITPAVLCRRRRRRSTDYDCL